MGREMSARQMSTSPKFLSVSSLQSCTEVVGNCSFRPQLAVHIYITTAKRQATRGRDVHEHATHWLHGHNLQLSE